MIRIRTRVEPEKKRSNVRKKTEKDLNPPENHDLLSPEAARLLLQELRLQQTKLELKNEQLIRTQEELENSRARYYDFYHASPVGFMTISRQAIVFESNISLNRLLMLEEHMLSHQSFVKFIHNEDRALFEQKCAALFQTGLPQSVHVRLSKGKTGFFWARIEAALAKDLVENLVARVVVIDISERKQAEDEQKRNATVQSALREIAEAAVFSTSLTELYSKIHAAVLRVSVAENFTIAILDEAKQEIAYHYRASDRGVIPMRRPVGFGLTEYIMKAGRTLYLTANDLAQLRESGEDQIAYVRINTWLGAPLIDPSGKIFGAIALFSKQNSAPGEFLSTEVFSAIAAQVSQAIERKHAEQKLINKEMLLRTIVGTIPDLVWLKDSNGRYLFCNEVFERLYGAKEAEIIGKTDYDFVSPELADLFCSYDRKVMLTGQQSVNEEFVTFAADQQEAFLETKKTPLRDAQGNLIGILGIARDISEHKKMQEKLQRQAITDELTGIYNRRHFMYRAEEEVQRMRRYGGAGSLLMLDLDSFKRVNDVFGHPVGDTVLQSVTEICQQMLRCNDVFGRIGGEEFAILLMETDVEQAKLVAERVRKSIEEAVFFAKADQAITLSVSIGVTQYNSPDDTLLQLLSRADNALYAAKNGGRNRVVVG